MPPELQRIQYDAEGRWFPAILALLLWQFMGSLLVECYLVFGICVSHCPWLENCRPLQSEDSIFIATIFLNFLMLVFIWNETLLWIRDRLFVNIFLVFELGKMMLVLPLYAYIAVDFLQTSNKWEALSWAFWSLTVIPGPYFLALIIAIVAKSHSRRSVQVSDGERSPLLVGQNGQASPETATRNPTTQGATLQEHAIASAQPSEGD